MSSVGSCSGFHCKDFGLSGGISGLRLFRILLFLLGLRVRDFSTAEPRGS